MPAGRPTAKTPELVDEICAKLSDGRSLRSVCNDESMPSKTTVFRWLREDEEFRDQYARAKEESADALVDEILDIADDGTNDWMERYTKDCESAGWQANGEHIQRSRLRIDTRKWVASKMKPKKYGEKVAHELTGPEGGPIDLIIEAVGNGPGTA